MRATRLFNFLRFRDLRGALSRVRCAFTRFFSSCLCEAGILYRGAIGEIGEGFESHIDA